MCSTCTGCIHLLQASPQRRCADAEDPAYARALQRLATTPGAGPAAQAALPLVGVKPPRASDENRAARGRPPTGGGAIDCEGAALPDVDPRSHAADGAAPGDAAEEGVPLLAHPRSGWLRSSLADPVEDFKAIARVRNTICYGSELHMMDVAAPTAACVLYFDSRMVLVRTECVLQQTVFN